MPADTVLIRLAVAAAILVPLSGCGDDKPETASTPPAVTTPADAAPATTPAPTSPAAEEPKTSDDGDDSSKKDGAKGDEPAAEARTVDPTPVTADAPESVKKASPKMAPPEVIADQVKTVHDALKKGGYKPSDPLNQGDRAGALEVKGTKTTILFFPSPRSAAENAAQYEKVFSGSPQSVTIVRKANRLFLLSVPGKPSDSEQKTFDEIRKIANDAI